MSLLDTASLIVTPNGYKEGKLYSVIPSDGSGDLSVTRATTATRVNSAGLVELVPYNYVRYSQEISNTGYWAHYLSTLTADTTTAPDGTLTADTIYITGSSGSAYQFHTYSGGIHTLSCYFKKINEDNVYIDGNSSSGYYGAAFNLTTQAITLFGGGFSPLIESVGNGWFRCSVQADGNGSGSYGFGVYAGAGKSAYIWGTQLNEGGLKDYQKTETRLNIPRLDYSNGTCPSLLVEPQRTNLNLFSEQFDNGAYSSAGGAGSGATFTTNYGIAPDGNQTADRFQITRGSNYWERYQRKTTTIGQTYTLSFWGKAVTGTPTLYTAFNNGYQNPVTFTNEWVRYTYTYTAAGTSTGFNLITWVNLAGTSATADVMVWGIQLELGNYSTSYIPTTSASVTRNADVISKTGISSLIGQTEGTIFADAYITGKDSTNGSILFATDKVSSGALIRIIYTSTNALRFDVFDGSSFQCLISAGAYNVGDRVKIAGGYKNNDFVMYVNGTQIGTDTSGSVPATDTANINTSIYGDTNGSFVNAAALWKTRLTNTQLQALTTI